MNNTVPLSIVTVCRNEVQNISQTCESIVEQMPYNFEWIVIDGGSTDGTLDILEGYRNRIDVLISEPDEGIYNAMNKGICRATGEYVVFMNGGDCFANDCVLETVACLPKSDVVYGDLALEDKNIVERYPDVLSKHYFLKNMLPHQATFFRRELFDQYGGFDETFRIAGDYELFVRLLHVHKVSYTHVHQPLAVFASGGISNSPKHRSLRKQENHRIRWQYFPQYRFSFKAIRQLLRNAKPSGLSSSKAI